MFESKFVAGAFLIGVALSGAGCSSAPDTSTSTRESAAVVGTLSRDEAFRQITAIRRRIQDAHVGASHALFVDLSLAPGYVAELKPIFARMAPGDKIPAMSAALVYTSTEVHTAVFDQHFFDDAVPESYRDLVEFAATFGSFQRPAFWPLINTMVQRSDIGRLTDLQIIELVGTPYHMDFSAGLEATGFFSAPETTASGVSEITGSGLLQGFNSSLEVIFGAEGEAHDIDVRNQASVALFTRIYSKARLLLGNNGYFVSYELGQALRRVQATTGRFPTEGFALAKQVLTDEEMEHVMRQLPR